MDEVENKIQNIELVLKDIEDFPQTYKTILKHKSGSGTCQIIIRRKLNKMISAGQICKMVIPGTRFGKVIFFSENKKYNILVETSRIGSVVYCFFEYKKLNKWYIELSEYWLLRSNEWEKFNEKKILFDGNILKLI